MKKLFAAVLAVLVVFGVALTSVQAQEENVEVTNTYELTAGDELIINKFAERIEIVVEEKGEAFRDVILGLIDNLAAGEKATERVRAVFAGLSTRVRNQNQEQNTNGTGTVAGTGDVVVETGTVAGTGDVAVETGTIAGTGDIVVETGSTAGTGADTGTGA